MSKILNIKYVLYQAPGSMRPRVHFPGHVVASGRLVRRSPTIDEGDNRSIDVSMARNSTWRPVLTWTR